MSSGVGQPILYPRFSVLEGGTDIASMVIFDPAALPDGCDDRMRDDPLSVIRPLADEGRLYWLNTSADGDYDLGVRVGGHLPEELAGFARLLDVAPKFAAPGGRLYFTGIEYAFRDDDSRLRRYPHMGASLEVPPGTYRLSLYEIDYPEGFHESLLRGRLSPGEFRLYSLMDSLAPLGCLGVLALFASVLWLVSAGLTRWAVTATLLWLVPVIPPVALSRTQSYRKAKRIDREIVREHPSYFAILEPVDDQPAAGKKKTPSDPRSGLWDREMDG
jgi:hypothetical protein